MIPDLYDYLLGQCPDLDSAKTFIHVWYHDWEQKLPWETGSRLFSLRAMAGHIAATLDGEEYCGFYMAHKHGSELYYAAI